MTASGQSDGPLEAVVARLGTEPGVASSGWALLDEDGPAAWGRDNGSGSET